MMPTEPLTLHLLGRPRWVTSTGAHGALSALDGGLIALLALDGPQPRDALAGQLWPAATPTRSANNLRQHVRRLRRDVAQHPVLLTGATLSLPESTVVDVHRITSMPMDDLIEAELLAGCDYTGNDFLQEWVTARRLSVRSMRADALAAHAEELERRNELAAAIRLAERIVDLSPLHEHAVRRLMRLHFRRADHTAAIAAFESFEHRLRDETGARPGRETRRLVDMIEGSIAASHEPVKALPVALVHPPLLVGRTTEWALMEHAWAEARSFLLLGEAGSGKSRLLAEFMRGRTGIVFERARAGDAKIPFDLLARLLRSVLTLHRPRLPEATCRELARLLPEYGAAPEAPADEGVLRHAIEAFLIEALGHGLTALVIDDVDVADLASLETLRWLGSSAALARLRLGLAARPLVLAPVGSFLKAWLDDSARPTGIDLSPLGPKEIDALVASLGLSELESPGLVVRLHAHAGGNPLFLLETLKQAWQRGDTRVLAYPPTVQAMIERRLLRLPALALDLLRVAAVAGPDFNAERAARLMGTRPMQLADAWKNLVDADVLQGERFAHDLIAECAARLIPEPLRRSLHAALAELLASEAQPVAARLAAHWQAAERWMQAGACWQRAAAQARHAGRLGEQQALAEHAADCFRRCGDVGAEFAALLAVSESVQVRHGGAAALAALPRLEALARDSTNRLQCRLVEAEALLELERSGDALAAASAAVALAEQAPQLQADALCMQSMALGQLGRADDAVTTGRLAVAAAGRAGSPSQELRATRSLGYVLYQLGRLGDALRVQTRVLKLALKLGDAPDTAAAQASIAALLGATGETLSSLDHARQAQAIYAQMGMARNSTNGAINLCVLGRAAAYLGRFDEAGAALEAAVAMAGSGAAISVQAKARITLAAVRLTLGDAARARELVETLPDGAPPGMQMQAAWVLASAAQLERRSGQPHLDRLARLGREHPDLPLVLSAWAEWSYQGDAASVVRRLRQIRSGFEAMGLAGTARSLQLRETARLLEIADDDAVRAAAAHAVALEPMIDSGLHAGSYPAEGWEILAGAFQRAGATTQAEECRQRGRDWILRIALPHVHPADNPGFLETNPVNRRLLLIAG